MPSYQTMNPSQSSSPMTNLPSDRRHHVEAMLMRESLLDKQVMSSTETTVVPMLPFCHIVKVGGRSILDNGKKATYPLVEALAAALAKFKLVIGTGGGGRGRHAASSGIDLGLPTGVLAQLAIIDSLGNAHLLGTLLAPHGVVAIPPEILGHMLPFFIKAAPGVVSTRPPTFLYGGPPAKAGANPASPSRCRHLPASRVLRLRDPHADQRR